MKYLWLVLLLACATEPDPEWIPTMEVVCVTNNQTGERVCGEPIPCWTNTRTRVINCDPEFEPV